MYSLVNLMEEIIAEKINELAPRLGLCDCKICREDAMAFCLNGISPRYVVAVDGKVPPINNVYSVESLTSVVTRVINKIKANPRHSEPQSDDLTHKNVMIEMIFERIPNLAEAGLCDCEFCQTSIVALSLNRLPSMYAVTQTGEVFHRSNTVYKQFNIDIKLAINSAVTLISSNEHNTNAVR